MKPFVTVGLAGDDDVMETLAVVTPVITVGKWG